MRLPASSSSRHAVLDARLGYHRLSWPPACTFAVGPRRSVVEPLVVPSSLRPFLSRRPLRRVRNVLGTLTAAASIVGMSTLLMHCTAVADAAKARQIATFREEIRIPGGKELVIEA